MAVTLSTNPAQATAARALNMANRDLTDSLKRLSTGNRIANIYDDAGGDAVQLKLKAQSARYDVLQNNLMNGISFLQVQEGVLTTASEIASRMGELQAMSTDPTKSSDDNALYDTEAAALSTLLTQLSQQSFNGNNILDGTSQTINVNVQATPNTMTIGNEDLDGALSNLNGSLTDISSISAADVDADIQAIATLRAQVGAKQSTLNYYLDNATVTQTNIDAARGRITDVDIADEASAYSIAQVKSQAASAMLAQANNIGTQNLMQLLM